MSSKKINFNAERRFKESLSTRQPELKTSSQVRVSRALIDPLVLNDALRWLREKEKSGILRAKRLGSLGLTVFDSQQKGFRLSSHAPTSVQEVTDLLSLHDSNIFEPTSALAGGIQIFGSEIAPFVGLVFAGDGLALEQARVKSLLAGPEMVAGVEPKKLRPHVTLGQQYSIERAREVIEGLKDKLPSSIDFAPAEVIVRVNAQD